MAMTSTAFRKAGLALALSVVPSIAPAQVAGPERIDEVRRDARSHLGPLYVTPAIGVEELGVDSNVFNAAGEQQSDFTFTLAPRADVWVPVARRVLLEATVAPDLVWYAHYDSERSIDPQISGRAEVFLHRITLFAEQRYLNSRQRLNHEIDLRARHIENTSTAGIGVRLTPKLSVEVAAALDETRFDADAEFDGVSLQRTLNQKTRVVRVTGRHRVTPLSTIGVRFERAEDEFPFLPVRDSRSFRIMPGVELNPRALIKGRAYVGYRKFTPADAAALPEFRGLVADLGLSYTLLGSTTFGVSYLRDLTYSYEELQPFFINDSVGASIRRALGRRFDAIVSADRHQYEYRNLHLAPALASPTGPRQDVTWNYAASIGYLLGQGRIGFGVSYWERDSPRDDFRNYDNLRFGTTVSYGF